MEEMNNVLFEEETIVEEVVDQVTSTGNGKKLLIGLAVGVAIGTGAYLVKKFRKKDEDDGVIVGQGRVVEEDEQEQSDK